MNFFINKNILIKIFYYLFMNGKKKLIIRIMIKNEFHQYP